MTLKEFLEDGLNLDINQRLSGKVLDYELVCRDEDGDEVTMMEVEVIEYQQTIKFI